MQKRLPLNALVLTVAVAIGAGTLVGPAFVRASETVREKTQGEGTSVANVDMQKIYAESEARVQAERKLREYNRKMTLRFEDVAKLQFVTFDELNDYNLAINAAAPTEAQTKRIADIQAAGAARSAEYLRLNAKKDAELTPQDRIRIRELNTIQQQRPATMAQVQRLYQDDLTQEEVKLNRAGVGEVRQAVQKLAKELNLTQVYDVSALVSAPTDITDLALRKVKAKGK